MEAPLLSVCLITYNHVKFIRQAIDSVLMQEVDFTWELIIADDCSTDGTREILLEYRERYPDFIKLILQERNVGPGQNWIELITYPSSEYIAYLEGDDYWTAPSKLQKQLNFLIRNPEHVLVFHDYVMKLPSGAENIIRECREDEYSLDSILRDCPKIRSSTIVLRNILLRNPLPSWIVSLRFGDWPLFLHLSRFGRIGQMSEVMSVYRLDTASSAALALRENDNLRDAVIEFYKVLLLDDDYCRLYVVIDELIKERIWQGIKSNLRKRRFARLMKMAFEFLKFWYTSNGKVRSNNLC